MNKTSPTIAAFDFDGTLTYRDALIPFFFFYLGYPKTLQILFFLLPKLILFPLGLVTRTAIKEIILSAFLKGKLLSKVEAAGKKFATGPLMKKLRPEAMKCLLEHQKLGHTTVVISANYAFFIYPWANRMRFDFHIASQAAVDENGCLTGQLKGENCWGEEKVRRLKEIFGEEKNYVLYAYGDSQGDAALLAYADYPYFRSFPLR